MPSRSDFQRLRPLNGPKPIRVDADARGFPLTVYTGRPPRPMSVAEIEDRWRIDDEWWRAEIQDDGTMARAEVSRMYFAVVLANRHMLTVYHDLVTGLWYEQTAGTPMQQAEPIDVLTPRVAPQVEERDRKRG